jgi:hypothetical protein
MMVAVRDRMKLALALVAVLSAPGLGHADPDVAPADPAEVVAPDSTPTEEPPPARVATVVVDGPPGSIELPPAPPPPDAVVAVTPPPLSAIAAQSQVVASQRGILTGTALTVPAGKVELGARTAFLASGVTINGGLSSTTELWAEAYGVVDEGSIVGAGIKQVLGRGDSWQLAATASVRVLTEENQHDLGSEEMRIGSVGGVLTMCTESCSVMLTGAVQLWMATGEESFPVGTLGVSFGGKRARLFGEIVRPLADVDDDDANVAFFGLRFGSTRTSFEIAIATADGEDEVLPILGLQTRL